LRRVSSEEDPTDQPPVPPNGSGPKAPAVVGTPDNDELTDAFGIFVAPSGDPGNDGSLARPIDTIAGGIKAAKQVGKRVYICAGTYHEQIEVEDSISVIGGLDCGLPTHWKTSALHSRIEAPKSPALVAKNIGSPTRIEGFDLVAPNASASGQSSIGILADHSTGLRIANSTVTAGDAGHGVDGTEAQQLVQTGSINGADAIGEAKCVDGSTCSYFDRGVGHAARVWWGWEPIGSSPGGTSLCTGAAGKNGTDGGAGGGRLYQHGMRKGALHRLPDGTPIQLETDDWLNYINPTAVWLPGPVEPPAPYAPVPGGGGSGAAGTNGANGAVAGELGALTSDGYAPGNGGGGADGAPGNGGNGGNGTRPNTTVKSTPKNEVWRGNSGAGGGAGGCPGLAGGPGTGGGASLAVAAIESPIFLENVGLVTGQGGNAGRGTFGSDPTPGGRAGANGTGSADGNAAPGGSGGTSGISPNGASGPSIAVLHVGPLPRVNGGSIKLGAGGSGVDERTNGSGKTIPKTLPGVSKEVVAL
jgi:hypothetical protein